MPSTGRAFARAGLLGNPSDGYGGKVVACPVRNLGVEVAVRPAEGVIIAAGGVRVEIPTLDEAISGDMLPEADRLERLVLAALCRFSRERPEAMRPAGRAAGLAIECSTTIPRQVGLAGSSATIIATLRALCDHFGETIGPFEMAEIALATEVEDLDIAAGPMDRVIQSYEQVLVMDFSQPRSPESYRVLHAEVIPPVLIAWTAAGGRSSGIIHSDLRERWDRGDDDVVGTMREYRDVVDRGVAALKSGDFETFADQVDRNFDLRIGVTTVTDEDARMVEVARAHGAAAKLCGSGGAVLVVPRGGAGLRSLERAFAETGFAACRPEMT